jgi:hypothetical protein
MNLSSIQGYVQSLIEAHPKFAAANLKTIPDDGTYPKLPGFEQTLTKTGLAIVVWRIGSLGQVDTGKSGVSNGLLHIAVVIFENVKVNLANGGTKIEALDALEYVQQAVSGMPRTAPPGTQIVPWHEPFENLGVVNGSLTIVADFVKQRRVTPIYPAVAGDVPD